MALYMYIHVTVWNTPPTAFCVSFQLGMLGVHVVVQHSVCLVCSYNSPFQASLVLAVLEDLTP